MIECAIMPCPQECRNAQFRRLQVTRSFYSSVPSMLGVTERTLVAVGHGFLGSGKRGNRGKTHTSAVKVQCSCLFLAGCCGGGGGDACLRLSGVHRCSDVHGDRKWSLSLRE